MLTDKSCWLKKAYYGKTPKHEVTWIKPTGKEHNATASKFVLEENPCTENAYLVQDWQNKFKKKVQS